METQSTSAVDFSLVLPCYNPPKGWVQMVVSSMQELTQKHQLNIHLILVNDGSTTLISEGNINELNQHISHFSYLSYPENQGKGAALRQGVEKSMSPLTIYTDIDFPYTTESLIAIYSDLKSGSDLSLGHRGESYYQNTPTIRKVISKLLRWTLKHFLKLPTDDSQCGLKGFNQNGKSVFLNTKINRFLFDLEFIKLASKKGLNCQTVEVHLKPNVVFSKVNLKILAAESINFFKILLKK